MNKNKKISLVFYIGAICFYIAAAVSFLNRTTSSNMGIVFICVGSSWVAIGGSLANKYKKEKSDNSSENRNS